MNVQEIICVLPDQELGRDELHVSCLPLEVLLHVFRQLQVRDLGRVALVCAGWRKLVYHKSLWSEVTLTLNRSQFYSYDSDRLLTSLRLRGIRKLETNCNAVLRDVSKNLPDMHCATLKDFQEPSAGPPVVSWSNELLAQMSNITQLDLRNAYHIEDGAIELIIEHLKKLVSLSLFNCLSITDRALECIAMGLPELKRLRLVGCGKLSDVGLAYLSGFNLSRTPAKLPQLQYFSSDHGLFHSNIVFGITEEGIRHLSLGQPKIQQLELRCLWMTDAAFQWLATFRELRRLFISFPYLSGSGLLQLANAQSPITFLDLIGSTDPIPMTLKHVGRLKQLRTLILSDTTISDADLEELVKGGGGAHSLISTLSLSCSKITDEGMLHVAQLRQLRKLIFPVGDGGLAHLADAQSPVAIVKCSRSVSDVGLSHAARLPNLQSLDLSDSGLITGAGLKEFVANVRGPLTELRLWGGRSPCPYQEVGLLERLARGLPNLTRLHAYGEGGNLLEIVAAARLLPRLHSLFVNRENVTEKVRSHFDGHVFH